MNPTIRKALFAAAIALPVTVWVMTPHDLFLCLITTALGLMAIYKHKTNLQRLICEAIVLRWRIVDRLEQFFVVSLRCPNGMVLISTFSPQHQYWREPL